MQQQQEKQKRHQGQHYLQEKQQAPPGLEVQPARCPSGAHEGPIPAVLPAPPAPPTLPAQPKLNLKHVPSDGYCTPKAEQQPWAHVPRSQRTRLPEGGWDGGGELAG